MIKDNSIYNEDLLVIFRLKVEQFAVILKFSFNRVFFNNGDWNKYVELLI